MSRIDGLLEATLMRALHTLRIDFDEIKNRQPTSGKSGVLAYLSQSLSTYDYEATLTSPATNYGLSATFELTFTGDGSQKHPIVNPFLDMLVSSSIQPTPSRPMYNAAAGWLQWSDGTNLLTVYGYLISDKSKLTSQLESKWVTYISYYGSVNFKAKAFTKGTSRGSVSLVRTY